MFQMVLSMEQRLQKAGYSAKTAGTIANLLTGMKKYEHIPPVIEELKMLMMKER